jgi:hypothetical protein
VISTDISKSECRAHIVLENWHLFFIFMSLQSETKSVNNTSDCEEILDLRPKFGHFRRKFTRQRISQAVDAMSKIEFHEGNIILPPDCFYSIRFSTWKISSVPWIHEHLTVESVTNFRDWSTRCHSRNWIFTVNERNSNSKFLQGKVEKTTQNINVFQIVGIDQIEQRSVVLSLRLKGLSKRPFTTSLLQYSVRSLAFCCFIIDLVCVWIRYISFALIFRCNLANVLWLSNWFHRSNREDLRIIISISSHFNFRLSQFQ